jgi:hypothetical protein
MVEKRRVMNDDGRMMNELNESVLLCCFGRRRRPT